jgi:hypothetical protein
MGEQQEVTQGLTMAIKQLSVNQKAMQTKVNELIASLSNLRFTVDGIREKLWNLKAFVLIESALSLFESYKQQEIEFENQFTLTKNLAEIGHVSESLVSLDELISILQKIGSTLTTEYIYQNFPVKLISLSGTRVAYIFNVPRVVPDRYDAWEINTVPYKAANHYIRIKPELSNLAISHTTGSVIDTSGCRHAEPMLCQGAIEYRTLPCVQGIVSQNADLIQSCQVLTMNLSIPIVLKVNPDELLVSTQADKPSSVYYCAVSRICLAPRAT